ncbi:MAG: hypothetical protein CMI63_15570 [Parvularcula sp.]|nr:hypothetical protein [Parvularcula sp.]
MERVLFAVSDLRSFATRIRPVLGDGSTLLICSHVAQLLLRIGSSLIVTRLLSPEAYGVIGIITSISYILVMISDMGLRAYIIRHEHGGDELLQSVWTVRLLRNVAIFAIMFVGAGVFAELYKAPEISLAIRICAAPFLIDACSSLAGATTERNRGVVRLTIVEFTRFLMVTVTTIIAAYFLRNYWAIVIGMFVNSIVGVIASYTVLKGPPVRFRLEGDHVRDLWRFWRIIIPSSIITLVLTQTNTVIMARFFPMDELGKFSIATTLSAAVMGVSTEYVMRVFFPRFAEANRSSTEQAKEIYYSCRRMVMLFFAFGIGGLIGGGELLIRILYNEEYLGTGIYLSLLCLTPLARLISLPAEQAIITRGFIRVALNANVLRLGWIAVAGPIAYIGIGPLALIAVFCLAETAALPYFLWHLKRYDLLDLREESYLIGAMLVGAAIGYVCYMASEALIASGALPNF